MDSYFDTFDRATDGTVGAGWAQAATNAPQIGSGWPRDPATPWSVTFRCGRCEYSVTFDSADAYAKPPQEYADHMAHHELTRMLEWPKNALLDE